MYCTNCGFNADSNLNFCPVCGKRLMTGPEVNARMQRETMSTTPVSPLIQLDLACDRCGALVQYDPETNTTKCPHCGKEGYYVDSERVTIEKIRSQTQKDLQTERLNYLTEKDLRKEERRSKENFRKGFGRVIMVFGIIALTCGAAFMTRNVLEGLLFLIQGGFFALAWLCGMQIITTKEKAYGLAVMFFIFGLIMFIPQFIVIGAHVRKHMITYYIWIP